MSATVTQSTNEESYKLLIIYFQSQQEGVFQVQLTPAILQQLSQGSLDMQTPRPNVVHSILTQPLHIAGQVPGQLPQIQMALAQVLPNQTESQTQVPTNTQPQVLVSANTRVILTFHVY